MQTLLSEKNRLEITKSYFEKKGLVQHQLHTFNWFISKGLKNIINNEPSIKYESSKYDSHILKFTNICVEHPSIIDDDRTIRPLYPQEARNKDMSYMGNVCVDIIETIQNNEGKIPQINEYYRVPIAKIPIMLLSDACHLRKHTLKENEQLNGHSVSDQGGYFIINGKERVLISQVRKTYNKPLCFVKTVTQKEDILICEMRSMCDETFHSTSVQVKMAKGKLLVSLKLKGKCVDVPVGIVFKSLGYHLESQDFYDLFNLPNEYERYFENIRNTCFEEFSIDTAQHESDDEAEEEDDTEALINVFRNVSISVDKEGACSNDLTIEDIQKSIDQDLFPHLGITSSKQQRAQLLALMIKKYLLTLTGVLSIDNRDDYNHKRVETAGELCYFLFRLLYKKFQKSCASQIKNRKPDILNFLRTSGLTTGILYSFSSGYWGVQRNTYIRTGVSQVVNPKVSLLANYSSLRRVVIPESKDGKEAKTSELRQIHPSSAFLLCPVETPEGKGVGTVLNMAIFCEVTVGIATCEIIDLLQIFENQHTICEKCSRNTASVIHTTCGHAFCDSCAAAKKKCRKCRMPLDSKDVLKVYHSAAECPVCLINKTNAVLKCGHTACTVCLKSLETCHICRCPVSDIYIFTNTIVCNCEKKDLSNCFPVFINGTPCLSVHINKIHELNFLKDNNISIVINHVLKIVEIFSDSGRLIRPVFDLEKISKFKSTIVPSFDFCLKNQLIKYVDINEIMANKTAIEPTDLIENPNTDYKLMELHPCGLFGIVASIIPFSDRTQSARNCFYTSMVKQAIGFVPCHNLKTETISHTLNYPQKPLVTTDVAEFNGINDYPNGINAIVAIMCYGGYNQEDSVILNKASLERGLFGTATYNTFTAEEKKNGLVEEKIDIPPNNVKIRDCNYGLLDHTGIVKLRQKVKKGDVLIGKITIRIKNEEEKIIDSSVIVQHGEEGYVDRIVDTMTVNGSRLVKVVIAQFRVPEIGDKFCSGMAQKGTCGIIYPQEDMPFSDSGMTPDIIINPNCIPSRMTINQIIATVMGKLYTLRPQKKFKIANPFMENSTTLLNDLCNQLIEHGFDYSGSEALYNGFTGRRIESQIFMGPTYYHRLKHMVKDKMHARSHGQVTTLHRQPNCGRAHGGGLRFGEMEKDCVLVHGATQFLNERMFLNSDPFQIDVCKDCGMMSSTHKKCHVCKSLNIKRCHIPYSFKNLLQELNAMGIKTKIGV